jgi:hypothetical protein
VISRPFAICWMLDTGFPGNEDLQIIYSRPTDSLLMLPRPKAHKTTLIALIVNCAGSLVSKCETSHARLQVWLPVKALLPARATT